MSEMMELLSKVEALIGREAANADLDLAVALLRLSRAVDGVKAHLEAELDAHIEQQATLHAGAAA